MVVVVQHKYISGTQCWGLLYNTRSYQVHCGCCVISSDHIRYTLMVVVVVQHQFKLGTVLWLLWYNTKTYQVNSVGGCCTRSYQVHWWLLGFKTRSHKVHSVGGCCFDLIWWLLLYNTRSYQVHSFGGCCEFYLLSVVLVH